MPKAHIRKHPRWSCLRYLLLLLGCLLTLPTSLHSVPVRFEWLPNAPEQNVKGYKLHRGNSPGQYAEAFDAGPVLTYTLELDDQQDWYVAATAYRDDLESRYSNAVFVPARASSPATATNVRVGWRLMANNFSGDANCKALWRFESGALTTDSIGSNTLTATGSPAADTTNYAEGSASVDLDSGDSYYITDANLDAGFPLKNGDATKIISVCAWVRFDTIADNSTIFSKYSSSGGNKRSFLLIREGTRFSLILGRSADPYYQWIQHTFNSLAVNTWYHLTAAYDDNTRAYSIRIRDAAGSAIGTDKTGTASYNTVISDAPVIIGKFDSTYPFIGQIDEVVVFNDVITSDEAGLIASGTYGASADLAIWASECVSGNGYLN